MNDLRWWLSSERVVLGAASQAHIAPAVIELTGGTISALYPLDGFCLPVAAAAERHVHYGDKLIAPAFINAHTHLALGFLRGAPLQQATLGNMVESYFFDIEQRMSKEDVYAFSLMGAYDSLLAGVGLVYDHYYAAEQVAQAIAEAGLMGVVAPTLQDVAGPGKHAWQQQLCVTETLAGNSWRQALDSCEAVRFDEPSWLLRRQRCTPLLRVAERPGGAPPEVWRRALVGCRRAEHEAACLPLGYLLHAQSARVKERAQFTAAMQQLDNRLWQRAQPEVCQRHASTHACAGVDRYLELFGAGARHHRQAQALLAARPAPTAPPAP